MKDKLNVGDIVCANYNSFTGEPKVGIFLIIYSERQDRMYTNGHTNLTCVKVTTNNLLGNSYTVRIKPGEANLESSCIINLSKMHTFVKEQIYKKLGRLSSNTMFNVFKELRAFNNEMEQQILENIY